MIPKCSTCRWLDESINTETGAEIYECEFSIYRYIGSTLPKTCPRWCQLRSKTNEVIMVDPFNYMLNKEIARQKNE